MALARRQLKFFLPAIDSRILRDLPDRPGVYRMMDTDGRVIYVGKAASLRQRVKSYFAGRQRHADHIFRMALKVRKIDYTVTGSVLEAAVIEADAIKELSPAYNIALRDRNRQTWFASSDVAEYGPSPDRTRPLGPMRTPAAFRTMSIIRSMAAGVDACPASDIEFLLRAIPGRYDDYAALFKEAWAGICSEHGLFQVKAGSLVERIVQMGKRLELSGTREIGNVGDSAEAEVMEKPETAVTAELIKEAVESRIAYAGREVRRLRWFLLLAESTLGWTEKIGGKYRRRLVVIEKGRLTCGRDLTSDCGLPVPPGYARKRADRQKELDRPAIDRMTVLTSEIRRIISCKRWICLRLSPVVVMDRTGIARTLQWL